MGARARVTRKRVPGPFPLAVYKSPVLFTRLARNLLAGAAQVGYTTDVAQGSPARHNATAAEHAAPHTTITMLYVHKGASHTTLEALRDYTVPTVQELREKRPSERGAGNRWRPIHHAELVDEIHAACASRGMTPTREGFALSKDTHSIYGFMEFSGYDIGLPGQAACLGFRSDNLSRFKLLGVAGSRVFICDNGAIVGDFVFGVKHTSGNAANLPVGIEAGMDRWGVQVNRMKAVVEAMQNFELTQAKADHLMMQMVRDGALNSQRLAPVDETFRAYLDPEHAHHEAFAPRNAWSLYNAVTEVAKGGAPRISEAILKGVPRTIARLGKFGTLLDAPAEAVSVN